MDDVEFFFLLNIDFNLFHVVLDNNKISSPLLQIHVSVVLHSDLGEGWKKVLESEKIHFSL